MTTLPTLVALLTNKFDAWVVGSAASPTAHVQSIRDWDIIVPYSEWNKACSLIPKNAKVNTFGGWKCVENGVEIDVWPANLNNLVTHPMFKYAWHPVSGTRIQKVS